MAETKRRLAGPVTVGSRTYRPGDDLPPEVVEQIRNPKAWAVDDDEAAAEAAKPKVGGTASGHRLASYVTVRGRTYSPDEPLPDDVAAEIRNPKAWAGGKVPDLSAKTDADAEAAGAGSATAEADVVKQAEQPEPADAEADGGEAKPRKAGGRRA